MSLGVRFHAKYIIFKQDIHILLKKANFLAIFTTGIETRAGADSNENEAEPESLSLVIKKEPKSKSGGDSKAGITPALVWSWPPPPPLTVSLRALLCRRCAAAGPSRFIMPTAAKTAAGWPSCELARHRLLSP